jgi:chromosome segregation ATPase
MHLSPKLKPSRLSFGHISPILSKASISIRSRGNISSPTNIKSYQLPETASPRYQSSVNKIRHDLTILLKDLNSAGAFFQKAKNSCKALELCANEEGIYQKEMMIIFKSVRESIFKEKIEVPEEILSNIYENHTEVILDNKEIPFFFIAESALLLLENRKKSEENLRNELSTLKKGKKYSEYLQELHKKKGKIENLQKKIQMDCEEPLKIRDKTIKLLEEQLGNSAKQVTNLNKQLETLEKECSKLKNQTTLHRVKLNEVEAEKDAISATNDELKRNVEELYKEIADSHADKLKFKLGFEKSILKLMETSQREKNLELVNQRIVENNSELSVKAAEGFTNLTPRPSFSGIDELLVDVPRSSKEKTREIISLALFKIKGEASFGGRRAGVTGAKRVTTKIIKP